jgi:hypothetical protein
MKNIDLKTIEKVFLETKSEFDAWLSPSEQIDFWATFGQKVYSIYFKKVNEYKDPIKINKKKLRKIQKEYLNYEKKHEQ